MMLFPKKHAKKLLILGERIIILALAVSFIARADKTAGRPAIYATG
jgi:hypothetical protein